MVQNSLGIAIDTTMVMIVITILLGIILVIMYHGYSKTHIKKEHFDSTGASPPLDAATIPDFLLNLDDKVNKLRLDVRMQGDKLDTMYTWYQQEVGQQQGAASSINTGIQSQLQAVKTDPESAANSIDVHGMLSQMQQAASTAAPGGPANQLSADVSSLNVPSTESTASDDGGGNGNTIEGFYGGRILFWSR